MSNLPRNDNPFLANELLPNLAKATRLFLIDVGARRGVDSRWGVFSSILEGLGFELDEQECERLNAEEGGRFHYIPRALFSHSGKQLLYDRKFNDASGLIEFPDFYDRFTTSAALELMTTTDIPCITLDEAWEEQGSPQVDFLKLDSEGAETEILRGAKKLLSSTELLGAEIETRFFNFGQQGRFPDVHNIMNEYGLHFFDASLVRHTRAAFPDIEEISGKKCYATWTRGAQVIASDVLYLRDFVQEERAGRVFSDADIDSLVKMLLIFESYELYDCAAEILIHFKAFFTSNGFDVTKLLDLIAVNKSDCSSYSEYMAHAASESMF